MSAKDGKPCKKCGSNEWQKNGDCTPCTIVRRRQYYEKNSEEAKEKARQWREMNPEKVKANRKKEYERNAENAKASARQWRKDNPEREKENARKWYQANKEKHKEYNRQWIKNNPDKKNSMLRRWRQENPEKAAASARRAKQTNPQAHAAHQNARRAKKAATGGKFTASEWNALVKHYGNKCLCCGRDDVKLTADHVIPVTKGGSSDIDNMQPLCQSCNSRKHDKIIDYRPGKGLGRWIQRKLFG